MTTTSMFLKKVGTNSDSHKREADGDPTLGSERDNGPRRRVYKHVVYL